MKYLNFKFYGTKDAFCQQNQLYNNAIIIRLFVPTRKSLLRIIFFFCELNIENSLVKMLDNLLKISAIINNHKIKTLSPLIICKNCSNIDLNIELVSNMFFMFVRVWYNLMRFKKKQGK